MTSVFFSLEKQGHESQWIMLNPLSNRRKLRLGCSGHYIQEAVFARCQTCVHPKADCSGYFVSCNAFISILGHQCYVYVLVEFLFCFIWFGSLFLLVFHLPCLHLS